MQGACGAATAWRGLVDTELGERRRWVGSPAWTIAALCASAVCLVGAIAPGSAAASGPVPLIVDTDIFSNVDDVGALASAFALQLRGETKVVAVTVNTRTSRPAVATSSWKCVAAIDNFYGFPSIPIGTHMPNNGSDEDSPYLRQCAQLAPASTPAPDSAVDVLRRALASQPDGSVVVASIGYQENLADLLRSAPDANSPLSGSALVAQKVRTLVVMGGTYPNSGSPENNLAGDPASAQYVAANWPTKIVWSGAEVGDAVRTGYTISSTHPANSPVRISFEAYAGANNSIPSYDLTAVYHAVRPNDSLLSEGAPGTNVIDSSGNNVFTSSSTGSQYYLTLSQPTELERSIEALLDTMPPTGQITGTVLDASTHGAVAGVLVQAYDQFGNPVAKAATASNGTYTLSGLYAGSYRLDFVPNSNYLPQFYNGEPTLATADPIRVTAGSTSTGVNAALAVAKPSNTAAPTAVLRPIKPAAVSSAVIRALLVKVLAAHGNGARIRALLKHDGYSCSFAAPSPGRLVISWYRASRYGKPVLVANVAVVFHTARTATIKLVLTGKGRTLLRGASHLKLIAKGSFTPVGQSTTNATKNLTLRP